MSAKLGGALLFGGAAGIAAGLYAPLPAKQKQLALYGGGIAAAAGLFLLLRAAKDAGGIVDALGSVFANNEEPLVSSVDVTDPAFEIKVVGGGSVPTSPQIAAEQGRPGFWVIPIVLEILSPAEDATVNPSLWSGTYPAQLRITNTTNQPFEDVVRAEVTERYAIGSDETASASSRLVKVPPQQSVIVNLDVPIGGGRVRYSSAYCIAKFRFREYTATTGYNLVP